MVRCLSATDRLKVGHVTSSATSKGSFAFDREEFRYFPEGVLVFSTRAATLSIRFLSVPGQYLFCQYTHRVNFLCTKLKLAEMYEVC